MTDRREDRLRERLASYGAALDEGAAAPLASKPKRHLIAVDGPGGRGQGRRRPARRREGEWRRATARVAAVLVVLAALAGTTWAATRPTETSTTASTRRGWSDGDTVRPQDRSSAFAALDGTWPLPEGGSIEYVLDRSADESTTFAGFRRLLAAEASCLWFRHAFEEAPDLTGEEQEAIAALPTWPGNADGEVDLSGPVEAALAGDQPRLRRYLAASCAGSGIGLGLPEIDGRWLLPGGEPAAGGPMPGGSASAVEVTEVRGWEAIRELVAPAEVDGAIRLPGGAVNIAMTRGGIRLSLTIARADGRVLLPVSESAFARGHELRDDGIEVFAGAVADDEATIAQAVGPDGGSVALSFASPPDRATEVFGNLADLAVDLHAAAWPR